MKQHKEARRMEKKDKIDRRQFLKIWMSSWVPVALVCGIALLFGILYGCDQYARSCKSDFVEDLQQRVQEMYNSSEPYTVEMHTEGNQAEFTVRKTSLSQEETQQQRVRQAEFQTLVSVYPMWLFTEEMQPVMEGYSACMLLYEGRYYSCENEEIRGKIRQTLASYDDYNASARLVSGYLTGDTFIPEKVEIYAADEIAPDVWGENTCRQTLDFSEYKPDAYDTYVKNAKERGYMGLGQSLEYMGEDAAFKEASAKIGTWAAGLKEETQDNCNGLTEEGKDSESGQHYIMAINRVDLGTESYYVASGVFFRPYRDNRKMICVASVGAFVFSILFATVMAALYYRIFRKEAELAQMQMGFTNTLAHDMKTPLMAVQGYSENLQQAAEEKRQHYIERIRDNVTYMNRMIEDILGLTKLRSMQDIEKQTVDLEALVRGILDVRKDQLNAKKLQLTITGLCEIWANRILMEHIFSNVIDNAIQYTPENGKIMIRMEDGTCEIRNTDVTIAEEVLERIWEPFTKGDQARTRQDGVGLGLAVVRESMELQGFRCDLKNEENCVRVSLYFDKKQGLR